MLCFLRGLPLAVLLGAAAAAYGQTGQTEPAARRSVATDSAVHRPAWLQSLLGPLPHHTTDSETAVHVDGRTLGPLALTDSLRLDPLALRSFRAGRVAGYQSQQAFRGQRMLCPPLPDSLVGPTVLATARATVAFALGFDKQQNIELRYPRSSRHAAGLVIGVIAAPIVVMLVIAETRAMIGEATNGLFGFLPVNP